LAESLSPGILFLAFILNTFLGFTHDPLVYPTLIRVHQLLVCLLKEMKGIRRLLMSALIRMNQDGEHAILLLDLFLAGLSAHFEYVIGVHECSAQESLQLVILSELFVLRRQPLDLCHVVVEFFVQHLLLLGVAFLLLCLVLLLFFRHLMYNNQDKS
jgi:hypothetical protein